MTEKSKDETKLEFGGEFDCFNHQPFAEKLTKAIEVFSQFEDEAYVLSLNAPFGRGKTTFLDMWENQLKGEGLTVLRINAWETDFGEDPILPIIGAILDGIGGMDTVELKGALKAGLALIGNSFVKKHTGADFKDILNSVQGGADKANLEKAGEELYQSYSFKQEAYSKIKNALKQYAKGLGKSPLIILVDELDRVRPNYAVEFLEAIKHIFSVKGICFVLAVDRGQLEKSAEQLYGKIDFDNYYRRFITREANLPVPDVTDYNKFVTLLMNKYSSKNKSNAIIEDITTVSKAFELEARQIQSFFKIFIPYIETESGEIQKVNGWMVAAVFLIAVSIKDKAIYHKIGLNNISIDEVEIYFRKLKFDWDCNKHEDTSLLYCIAAFIQDDNSEEQKQRLIKLIKENCNNYDIDISDTVASDRYILQNIHQQTHRRIFTKGIPPFSKIYGRIENWKNTF